MKKRSLKTLSLNKKSISTLHSHLQIGGTDWPETAKYCPPSGGYTGRCSDPCRPIELPTIDIPTINDSCFSWCDDKCNDW